MKQTDKNGQMAVMQQMVAQQSWVKTPWRYIAIARGDLSLVQQQALLMVSEHLQGYIKRFFDLGLDKAQGKPKSLFSEYLIREGIPPFRIYLQDIGIAPSHYGEARKVIEEINMQVEHPAFDEDGHPTGETKRTNVFSQFGFEETDGYYHYTGKDGKAGFTQMQQPWIDVKINPDVAEWAFDMSQGYVNHLKMIALYSTKRSTPRVYLLLMRALKKNDQRTDLRVPLTELKDFLGIRPYKDKKTGETVTPYPMFSNFRQKVLDAVRDDLCRMAREVPPQTDITFDYEPVYPGRRKKGDPEAILFHIERTVLGTAYSVVVNHARLPLEPDMFDSDPQQQPFRDAFRRTLTDIGQTVGQGEAMDKFAALRFERYDDKSRVLLLQVTSREHYEWMESEKIKPFFVTQLKRHFPEIDVLNYRVPR